jgi:hypothetical protein
MAAQKTYQAVEMPTRPGERPRYCIVSTETGEVLDDAQGYGYKTAQKAYAGYGYKHRDKSKDAEKAQKRRYAQKWLKEHPKFVKAMDAVAWEITKGSWEPGAKFDAKAVKELLKSWDLAPDCTPSEILRAWEKL